jgi:hypothetical protein
VTGAQEGSEAGDGPTGGGVASLAWSRDGQRLLVVTASPGLDGADERDVWSYDVPTSSWSQRSEVPAGVVAAVERRDGSLVAITEDALVIGGESQPRRGVNGLVLGPDGMTVVAFGEEGALLVDETGGTAFLTGGTVTRAHILPDGSPWLVLGRVDEASGKVEIASLPLGGGPSEPSVLGTSAWGWFEVLPDASGLLVSVDGPTGSDGFATPVIERWPFATG